MCITFVSGLFPWNSNPIMNLSRLSMKGDWRIYMFKIVLIMISSTLVIIGLAFFTQHLVSEKEIVLKDHQSGIYPVNVVKRDQFSRLKISTSEVSDPNMAFSVSSFRPMSRPSDAKHADFVRLKALSGEPVSTISSGQENYASYEGNGVLLTREKPVSTFSIDVDTGSYSNLRRMLNMGTVPVSDAIRVEEMINYFSYEYAGPTAAEIPFSISTELVASPWNNAKHLLRIGIKGYEVDQRLPANLVFLIDVSGSMNETNKLPLVKASLKMLVSQLEPDDVVSIVTYAGRTTVVLEPTGLKNVSIIRHTIDNLVAGGSTNGEGGLKEAYRLARTNYSGDGINRVFLATDGDFNVGMADVKGMKEFISKQRKSGIGLTALGYGMGNYNDEMLEQLADSGNGNHAYIDSLNEARKVLVEQLTSTLQTIAEDVKIQVEFNPQLVAEYRLVGYENRIVAREDFNNDKVDAGEIGAGHTVTALYELALTESDSLSIDPLRYGENVVARSALTNEVAILKLRYKEPGRNKSKLLSKVVTRQDLLESASADTLFAAAVAGFGQLLKGGKYIETDYRQVLQSARSSSGGNPGRVEFV
jgi:Ca-activated chloride channel family protein